MDSWGSGFVLNNYTVTNTGTSPVTGWTATLSFDRTVSVTNSWGIAFATTSGSTLSGSNVSWNGNLAPGQSVTFGLQGTTSGNISPPACSAD
ncbi:MAG: hypothetical protein KatS3mg121_0227 [Gammaproteobacteria bacterium]|nr:MAG: hypothetical protein KatS3mg121_0227 [Gammaproteobacteria bacterium]